MLNIECPRLFRNYGDNIYLYKQISSVLLRSTAAQLSSLNPAARARTSPPIPSSWSVFILSPHSISIPADFNRIQGENEKPSRVRTFHVILYNWDWGLEVDGKNYSDNFINSRPYHTIRVTSAENSNPWLALSKFWHVGPQPERWKAVTGIKDLL